MLTENQIDKLVQSIKSGEDTYIYYVSHMIQSREGILDEHIYKSVSQFKVIKVQVTDIVNAWFEYKNFIDNPDDYHLETEEEYYDEYRKYYHYYTVKNSTGNYELDINPRFPSIIYGYRRMITDRYKVVHDTIEPSPLKEVYTNAPTYGDLVGDDLTAAIKNGDLDWKYMTLSSPETVDGVDYKYVNSNYYILTLANYPSIEKPLIYAGQHSAYFLDPMAAFYYVDQLIA